MSFEESLVLFRQQNRHGVFELRVDERIDAVVRREEVPNAPGVYVISTAIESNREILYIGKAGTICQDGSFKSQGLKQRLIKKQDGVIRHIFFRTQMESLGLQSLRFEWFATFEAAKQVPPFLAESQLLAAFFSQFNRLPLWNKGA